MRTNLTIAIGLLGAAGAGACSLPPEEAGFDSPSPAERMLAAAAAAEQRDEASVPQLVEMLDSRDPAVRMVAQESLYRITGTTLGYRYQDPERDRVAAIARWEARVRENLPAGAGDRPNP
ncbi:MAG: HEAT repeat domain-containing protein [Planctomycetota bacterium]